MFALNIRHRPMYMELIYEEFIYGIKIPLKNEYSFVGQ